MSKDRNQQNSRLILGAAALAASLVGTVASLFTHEKQSPWQAYANKVTQKSAAFMHSNLVLGGLAGGLVAVTTALLLAPKSGKELIKDLAEPFISSTTHKEKEKKEKKSDTKKDKVGSKNLVRRKNPKIAKDKETRATPTGKRNNSKRSEETHSSIKHPHEEIELHDLKDLDKLKEVL